jgi:hypothetical protein
VPNGFDRAFVELAMFCASYRLRFDEWPTDIRLTPSYLRGIAILFDGKEFEKLGERLRFHTERGELAGGGHPELLSAFGEVGSVEHLFPPVLQPPLSAITAQEATALAQRWVALAGEAREWLAVVPP